MRWTLDVAIKFRPQESTRNSNYPRMNRSIRSVRCIYFFGRQLGLLLNPPLNNQHALTNYRIKRYAPRKI